MEFGDHGDLGDGDVVERPERADDCAAQEECGEVDVASDKRQNQRFLGAESGDAAEFEEDPRKAEREQERAEGSGESHRGRR